MSSQDTGISESSGAEKNISGASSQASQQVSPQINDQEVANYLRRHPNFFEDKPSLLSDLRVPHQAGSAVSLVERQVATLRESNENRQAQLDGLIQIARDNESLNFHLHQLTLRMMGTDELNVLLTIISDRLIEDFEADLAVVQLLHLPLSDAESNLPEIVTNVEEFSHQFQHILSGSKPYCGRLKDEQLQTLFEDRTKDVGSTALLPLGKEGSLGLLAVASFDRHRFTLGTDTHFLARMAEIITAALDKRLIK